MKDFDLSSCATRLSILVDIHSLGDVTPTIRNDDFLAQHSVAMLEQCCNYSKQCCNAVLRQKSSLRIVSWNITFKLDSSSWPREPGAGSEYLSLGNHHCSQHNNNNTNNNNNHHHHHHCRGGSRGRVQGVRTPPP